MEPTAARCLFPLTKQFIFMNHAGVAPMSERARAPLENLMEQLVGRAYPPLRAAVTHFYNTVEEVDHVLQLLAPVGVTAA